METKVKCAVVTGASTGIGKAIAIKLASQNIKVFLLARSKEKLEKTLNIIKDHHGKGEVYKIDLTNTNDIKSFCHYLKNRKMRVDYLCNVAGVWHSREKAYYDIDFTDYSIDEISLIYKVGLNAPTLLCHGLIPLMSKGSHILNISGTFEDGAKGWLPYYVSKKAIEDLTIGLSEELKDKDIFVNCISPGDVSSEAYKKFFPQYCNPDSCLSPDYVAEEVLYLFSQNKTGEIIVIKKE
jgi:short-subunit dehydrogenase